MDPRLLEKNLGKNSWLRGTGTEFPEKLCLPLDSLECSRPGWKNLGSWEGVGLDEI